MGTYFVMGRDGRVIILVFPEGTIDADKYSTVQRQPLFLTMPHYSMWKFQGQGLNLCYSRDPSHSNDNTRSLTTRPPGNSTKGFTVIVGSVGFRAWQSLLSVDIYFHLSCYNSPSSSGAHVREFSLTSGWMHRSLYTVSTVWHTCLSSVSRWLIFAIFWVNSWSFSWMILLW